MRLPCLEVHQRALLSSRSLQTVPLPGSSKEAHFPQGCSASGAWPGGLFLSRLPAQLVSGECPTALEAALQPGSGVVLHSPQGHPNSGARQEDVCPLKLLSLLVLAGGPVPFAWSSGPGVVLHFSEGQLSSEAWQAGVVCQSPTPLSPGRLA